MTAPKLLTMEEVADVTRTPVATLRYLRHMGKGPRCCKPARRVLYRESDVIAWLDEAAEADDRFGASAN